MPAIHPKKELQRIWRGKGDRRRVHARPAGSRCRFAKNRVYRRNLCCIPRATKTGAVKEIDAARHWVEGDDDVVRNRDELKKPNLTLVEYSKLLALADDVIE